MYLTMMSVEDIKAMFFSFQGHKSKKIFMYNFLKSIKICLKHLYNTANENLNHQSMEFHGAIAMYLNSKY